MRMAMSRSKYRGFSSTTISLSAAMALRPPKKRLHELSSLSIVKTSRYARSTRLSFAGSRVVNAFGTGAISGGTLARSSETEVDVLVTSSLTWFGVSSAVFMSEFWAEELIEPNCVRIRMSQVNCRPRDLVTLHLHCSAEEEITVETNNQTEQRCR